ncbi:hypothetical protein L596_008942 [Steinernema carpocapsae]|uniref:Uncharacterized protein n=1 Tax=Steinernema carpocapsae TaxID=34508 RepID=A0A4U5PEG3_STECR|nr:hypothetical protein L596_008942 [Steinernema carpocapsae]
MWNCPLLFVLLPLAVLALPPLNEEVDEWRFFVTTHQKTYSTKAEEAKRFGIFMENLRLAKKRAAKEQGTATFGIDKFSDMTVEEFRTTRLMNKKLVSHLKRGAIKKMVSEKAYECGGLPKSFDWRDHHAVTGVKDQGQCGSCWAFSTAANIESVYAVKKGKLYSLSEQEIVDCDSENSGCSGGWPIQAMKDIEKLGGLEKEDEYKYEAEDDKCRFNKSEVVVQISDAVSLSHNEDKIAAYLVQHGGVSVAFNAEDSIMGYTGGIVKLGYDECSSSDIDHAVLLVGYGTENDVPFWIVKNSWGADWGESGYFRIFRGGNTCGIAEDAVSAVVN